MSDEERLTIKPREPVNPQWSTSSNPYDYIHSSDFTASYPLDVEPEYKTFTFKIWRLEVTFKWLVHS